MAVLLDVRMQREALAAVLAASPRLSVRQADPGSGPLRCDVALVRAGVRPPPLAVDRRTRLLAVGPDDTHAANLAFAGGATGYLGTAASPDDLVTAVHAVAEGQVHLAGLLATELGRRAVTLPDRSESPLDRLTPRQREVIELLATGLHRTSIAAALDVSPATVRTHLRDAFRRLEVHSGLEAVSVIRRARAGLARTA